MKVVGHGYVTEVFYNDKDGWWYGRGLADTDEAVEAIKTVGKCSTGYDLTGNFGPGGTWHDIPYDKEILGFTGQHLAVVDNPRYEEAGILLNAKNNQRTTPMNVFKWIRKQISAAQTAAAPAATDSILENGKAEDVSGDTVLTIPGTEAGKTVDVKLSELVEAFNNKTICGDDEITHNGKTYKVNALVEAFDIWEKTKTNAADEEKKKKEEEEKLNAKRVADEAAQKLEQEKQADEKLNAKPAATKPDHFNILLNAQSAAPEPQGPVSFNTLSERIARGNENWGAKNITKK